MAVYMVAWPDHSWSVLVCEGTRTVEELCALGGPLDATADPACASIFRVKKEGGEFYCDFYADGSKPGQGSPLVHWGDLVPVRLVEPYTDQVFQSLEEMSDE